MNSCSRRKGERPLSVPIGVPLAARLDRLAFLQGTTIWVFVSDSVEPELGDVAGVLF